MEYDKIDNDVDKSDNDENSYELNGMDLSNGTRIDESSQQSDGIEQMESEIVTSLNSEESNDNKSCYGSPATKNSERSFPVDRLPSDVKSTPRKKCDLGNSKSISNDIKTSWNPNGSLLELAYKLKQAEYRVFGIRKDVKPLPNHKKQQKSKVIGAVMYNPDNLNDDDVNNDNLHDRIYTSNYKIIADEENLKYSSAESSPEKFEIKAESIMDEENGDMVYPTSVSSFEDCRGSVDSPLTKDLVIKRRHQCKYCKYSTDRMSHLRRHELSIHFKGGQARQRAGVVNGSHSDNTATSSDSPIPLTVLNTDAVKNISPEKRKYHCELCGYQTDCVSHLRRHMGSVHNKEKLFRCNVCTDVVEFARSEKVKEHFLTHHPDVPCDLKKLKTPHPLVPATSSSSPSKVNLPAPPPSCKRNEDEDLEDVAMGDASADAELANLVNLSIKNKVKDSKPFRCPQCSYAARDVWHMRRHIGDRHVRQRHYKCRVCRYETGRIDRLFVHQRSHGEMFCLYCDSFSTIHPESYKSHMISCASSRTGWTWDSSSDPFSGASGSNVEKLEQERTCRICNEVKESVEELERHMDEEHIEVMDMEVERGEEEERKGEGGEGQEKKVDTRQRACKLCDYTSDVHSDMYVHVSSHAPHSFPCDVLHCDFKSTYARTLELHQRFYHGRKFDGGASAHKAAKNKSSGLSSEENSRLDGSGNMDLYSATDALSKLRGGNQLGFNYNSYINSLMGRDDSNNGSAFTDFMNAAAASYLAGALPSQLINYINEAENYKRELLNRMMTSSSSRAASPYGSAASHGNAAHSSSSMKGENSGLQEQRLGKSKDYGQGVPKHGSSGLKDFDGKRDKSRVMHDDTAVSSGTLMAFSADSPDVGGSNDGNSGIFYCPVCVDRAPFKYRKSYEKHLSQHASSMNL